MWQDCFLLYRFGKDPALVALVDPEGQGDVEERQDERGLRHHVRIVGAANKNVSAML